jgi:hypothetical protein
MAFSNKMEDPGNPRKKITNQPSKIKTVKNNAEKQKR